MNSPENSTKTYLWFVLFDSNWRGPVRVSMPLKYPEKSTKNNAGVKDVIKITLSYIWKSIGNKLETSLIFLVLFIYIILSILFIVYGLFLFFKLLFDNL